MKERYPWLRVTLLSVWLFVGFFIITYAVAGLSYRLVAPQPADQSREMSWLYYGVLFSILPYLPMGALLSSYLGRWPRILAFHAVGVGFVLEKGAFVYFGTLLGTGYPWYGRNFPWSGHAVLCEELPMYCGSGYVWSYTIWGTIVALGACYAGTRIVMRGRKNR